MERKGEGVRRRDKDRSNQRDENRGVTGRMREKGDKSSVENEE